MQGINTNDYTITWIPCVAPAGTPVNGPTTTASSTCAPLNIFGTGSPSLAAQQYITHLATVDSYNTQRDATAFIAGDILKVPAGDWKFSAGFENRRESADFSPDDFHTTACRMS